MHLFALLLVGVLVPESRVAMHRPRTNLFFRQKKDTSLGLPCAIVLLLRQPQRSVLEVKKILLTLF